MINPLIGALIYLAIGAFTIRFARSAYRRPENYLLRWFPNYIVPPFRWTSSRQRKFAVIWIFGGVLIIMTGLTLTVPSLPRLPIPVWV